MIQIIADLQFFSRGFSKFYEIKHMLRDNFFAILFGSAVLTFIGYKQTKTKTDK